MFVEINSIEEYTKIKEEQAVLAYFSTDICHVCKVLKPKVAELISQEFPKIKLVYINSNKLPQLAAQNQVFVAPTIIVLFNGKEQIRKSRHIGIDELRNEIHRPYSIIFD